MKQDKKFPTLSAIFIIGGLIGISAIWGMISFLSTPMDVSVRIAAAKVSLAEARKTGVLKVSSAQTEMPIPEVNDAKQRKNLFVATVLPLILRETRRIEEQREIAIKSPPDSSAYKNLAQDYGLEDTVPRKKLLMHVDIVPASLVLAQAALESGWGQSRFAREGNALFGERTFDMDEAGMVPLDVADGGTKFKVKRFSSLAESIRSYLKTLNTHAAYAQLRKVRADLRSRKAPLTGKDLAPTLFKYSEIGAAYVKRLLNTIQASQMHLYDKVRLAS
jgi:Bax protein